MISTEDYRKSTFSNGGGCVEVRLLEDGTIALRDSKDRSKDPHLFNQNEWIAFLAGVRNGEFDLYAAMDRRVGFLGAFARSGRRKHHLDSVSGLDATVGRRRLSPAGK